MATISSVGLRQSLALIKKAYQNAGRNPITTASDLKLIVPVVTNKTSYTFPVLMGDDTFNFPEGILLNRADAFTATEMGLFIGKKTSNNDTTYDLFSYPNNDEFGATDADTFKTLFNHATIDITINNVQYLQNYSVSRMRTVGITQQKTGQQEEFNATHGFYPMVPTLQFSGTNKSTVTLNLPSSLTAAVSGSYVIILQFRGFLSLGASNLNK